MPYARFLRFLLAMLLFCSLPGYAATPALSSGAVEGIESFSSFVTIHADGSLLVREEITAISTGDQIKTGIYRDFPLAYSGPEKQYGGTVPFSILSTSLDGKKLHQPTDIASPQPDVIRIFIRDGDKKLSRGKHVFVLEYITSLHLRFFADHGELNWNVTGPEWAFPIRKVFCRITLPDGVPVGQTIGWLGSVGDKADTKVDMSIPTPNVAEFTGRGSVPPGEQMTVAVAFPKDMVADPMPAILEKYTQEKAAREAEQQAAREASPLYWAFMDHLNTLRYGLALLLVLAYFGILWWRKGKDPVKGSIIPRFHPPMAEYMGKGKIPADFQPAPMSPAAVEYLRGNLTLSSRGFAALFLSLAVRGFVAITRNTKGIFTITPREGVDADACALSPEERTVHAILRAESGPEGQVPLTPRQKVISSIHKEVLSVLSANYDGAWSFNRREVVLGWLLVLPLCCWLAFLSPDLSKGISDADLTVLFGFPATVYLGGCLFFALTTRQLVLSVFVSIFGGAALLFLDSENVLDLSRLVVALAMTTVACVFSRIMKAPTSKARQVMDEIEGLYMYMAAAEQDRMKILNQPEELPEVFEKLLPYALCLGLEQTWCDRFAAQISAGLLVNGNSSAIDLYSAYELTAFARECNATVMIPSMASSSGASAFSSDGGGAGSGTGGGGGGGI